MTTELALLFWSLVVYAVYLGTQSIIFRMDYGVDYAATARDEEKPRSVRLGRAERALRNFLETYPAFIVLALVANFAAPGDGLVYWGAIVWFVARIAYLPVYLAGTFMIRSLAWTVSAIGLGLMFLGVLF